MKYATCLAIAKILFLVLGKLPLIQEVYKHACFFQFMCSRFLNQSVLYLFWSNDK